MQAAVGREAEPVDDLRSYLRPISQRVGLIVVCGLALMLLVFVAFPVGEPKYESSASVLIGPAISIRAKAAASTDLQTEADLAMSRAVTSIAAVNLFDGRTAEELGDTVSVTTDGRSKLIVVKARDTVAKRATRTAQAVADAYVSFRGRQIREKLAADRAQLDKRAGELRAQIDAKAAEYDRATSTNDQRSIDNQRGRLLAEVSDVESALLDLSRQSTDVGSVVGPADVPEKPASNPAAFRRIATIGGLLVGLAGGAVLAYVLDAFDAKIRDPLVLRRLLGRPVLAAIPFVRGYRRRAMGVTVGENHHATSDGYRRLWASFAAVTAPMERRDSFLVTSMLPNELKSTVTANLATGLATQGFRVVAVSADLRQPALHLVFGIAIRGRRTLGDVLRGDTEVTEALVRTSTPGLWLLPSTPSSEGIHLLETTDLSRLIDDLTTICDIVIFDGAPLIVADSLAIGSVAAGTVLVASAGSPCETIERARTEIESVGGRVVAGVLTMFRPRLARHMPGAYARDYRLRDHYGDHPEARGLRGFLGRALTPEPVRRVVAGKKDRGARRARAHSAPRPTGGGAAPVPGGVFVPGPDGSAGLHSDLDA